MPWPNWRKTRYLLSGCFYETRRVCGSCSKRPEGTCTASEVTLVALHLVSFVCTTFTFRDPAQWNRTAINLIILAAASYPAISCLCLIVSPCPVCVECARSFVKKNAQTAQTDKSKRPKQFCSTGKVAPRPGNYESFVEECSSQDPQAPSNRREWCDWMWLVASTKRFQPM